jgi:hypothetical protein
MVWLAVLVLQVFVPPQKKRKAGPPGGRRRGIPEGDMLNHGGLFAILAP